MANIVFFFWGGGGGGGVWASEDSKTRLLLLMVTKHYACVGFIENLSQIIAFCCEAPVCPWLCSKKCVHTENLHRV